MLAMFSDNFQAGLSTSELPNFDRLGSLATSGNLESQDSQGPDIVGMV